MYDPNTPSLDSAVLLDALKAVCEAIDIPHGATVGDQIVRDRIHRDRAMHAKIMLRNILDYGATDIPTQIRYLRECLASCPAQGYKTWDDAAERA